MPSIRREVQALDPQLPLFAAGTLERQVAATLTLDRVPAPCCWRRSRSIAVLLAAIGIYGVTAHAVGQRTHEVGIRMALGARAADVLRLMLAQHLRPALAASARRRRRRWR